MDIQQGNMITSGMLSELQIGLSRDEVNRIMGSVSLQHPLEPARWDYVYSLKTDDGRTYGQKRCTLVFKRDKLQHVALKLEFKPGAPQNFITRIMGEPTARSKDNQRWDYVFHLPVALGQRRPVYFTFWFKQGKMQHFEETIVR